MARTTPIDKLNQALAAILTEYADDIERNMGDIVAEVCKNGTKTLRAESRSKFEGNDYASGWTNEVEKGRMYSVGTIYNKHYSLPHLLEYGHAVIRGGRKIGEAKPHEHIAPVAEKLVKEFEKELTDKL